METKIKIKIEYEPTNKIYLSSNEKRTLILSDENKEISAKTILEFLNYKKENIYELEGLSEDISNLDENNKNLDVKIIPAGKYAKFSICGNMVTAVVDAWQQIWQMDLDRSFTGDFEEYKNADVENAEIDIYVALK